jgi:hypothetical protein
VALYLSTSPQPGMRRYYLPSRRYALQAVITTTGRYLPRADISSVACSAPREAGLARGRWHRRSTGQILAGELGEHVAFIWPVKAFQVSAAFPFRLVTRVLLQMLWRRRVVRVEILQAGHVERPEVAPDRGR